jgi:hypothetical protein
LPAYAWTIKGKPLDGLVAYLVEVSRINPDHRVTLLLCPTDASRAAKILLRKLALDKFGLDETAPNEAKMAAYDAYQWLHGATFVVYAADGKKVFGFDMKILEPEEHGPVMIPRSSGTPNMCCSPASASRPCSIRKVRRMLSSSMK